MNDFCFRALFSAILGSGMRELRSEDTVEQAVSQVCVADHRTQGPFSDLCQAVHNPFSIKDVRCPTSEPYIKHE